MKNSTRITSEGRGARGFTLLEVMVSIAILAITVLPMLLLREESFNKAVHTKAIRTAQELAQQTLSQIALEVREGEHRGSFEGWPDFRYEYKVTLYDFGMDTAEFLDEEDEDEFEEYETDRVELDSEDFEYGPLVMRHVELTVFYPSQAAEGEGEEEYLIDTYMPVLLTEEQHDYQTENP